MVTTCCYYEVFHWLEEDGSGLCSVRDADVVRGGVGRSYPGTPLPTQQTHESRSRDAA